MARPVPTPPRGFNELSVEEKIDYLGALWDLIASDPGEVPVPSWHREILEQRVQAEAENPSDVEPWDSVRERIQTRLQKIKE